MCSAFDEEDATEQLPRNIYDDGRTSKFVTDTTLAAWIERLLVAGKAFSLIDCDAQTINRWTTEQLKDADGPGRYQLRAVEYALSKFYRFHTDLGIDPRDIIKHEIKNGDGWGPRDMLEPEERAALRAVADHPRDRVIVDLALYCGLRNTAIRTLRVKDIDLDNHEFYFNAAAAGLKNISEPKEPRPLFQAYRAVREWLDRHPTNDPDHYFVTHKPSWTRKDPTSPLTSETIEQVMRKLKAKTHERTDVASVHKPCHPHMLRHNFVTQCRRHPDITDDDIKFFIGHEKGSNVMQTTYSHISPGERNQRGHAALGADGAPVGDSDGPPPWDTTCRRCHRVLIPGLDECPECGESPGDTPWDDTRMDDMARALDDALIEMIAESSGEKAGKYADMRRRIRDDPSLQTEALEQIADRIELD